MTEIRNAEASDAAELASIYRYYVEETAISFEYTAMLMLIHSAAGKHITEVWR